MIRAFLFPTYFLFPEMAGLRNCAQQAQGRSVHEVVCNYLKWCTGPSAAAGQVDANVMRLPRRPNISPTYR